MLLRKRQGNWNRSGGRVCQAAVETLEQRQMLSCNSISGYVYADANNNGLYDVGETPIANSQIELHDANGAVVGTTQTNAAGYYLFDADQTVPTTPQQLEYQFDIPDTRTNFVQSGSVAQFDPALGTLTSVEVVHSGGVTSTIKVESFDVAPASTTATVGGTLSLVGPGVNSTLSPTFVLGSFDAAPYDGTFDFGGASGHDFGTHAVSDSGTTTLSSAADLAFYTGTGSVSFTESVQASSSTSGAGNFASLVLTDASAQVQVIYHYIPDNCLKPGDYTIVQTIQPAGYDDGQETAGNITPIPGSAGGPDSIPVTITDQDSVNNNFGEVIPPASISGYVYYDANDDGDRTGDAGIAGATVTLTGTDSQGNSVLAQTSTDAGGYYHFDGLLPGDYTLTETQPAGYDDGKDTIGSLGGVTANDVFSSIAIAAGDNGIEYNFGEILTSPSCGTGGCDEPCHTENPCQTRNRDHDGGDCHQYEDERSGHCDRESDRRDCDGQDHDTEDCGGKDDDRPDTCGRDDHDRSDDCGRQERDRSQPCESGREHRSGRCDRDDDDGRSENCGRNRDGNQAGNCDRREPERSRDCGREGNDGSAHGDSTPDRTAGCERGTYSERQQSQGRTGSGRNCIR